MRKGLVPNILYQGVTSGWYPPLVSLGIGAMTDFSALISTRSRRSRCAAPGFFGAIRTRFGYRIRSDASGRDRGTHGGADGPTAIFLRSKPAPNPLGAMRVCLFLYGISTGTTAYHASADQQEKRAPYPDETATLQVSHTEKVMFPIIGLLLTCFRPVCLC